MNQGQIRSNSQLQNNGNISIMENFTNQAIGDGESPLMSCGVNQMQ